MSVDPRITSIENLIARDPGERNVWSLLVADQLRLAAQSLRLAKRVVIVSGFYIPEARAGETDGPPGAKVVGAALAQLGIEVIHVTDRLNAPLFAALGIEPVVLPTPDDPASVNRHEAPPAGGLPAQTPFPIGDPRASEPTSHTVTPRGLKSAPRHAGSDFASAFLDRSQPTHLIAIERAGRGADGRFRNMLGVDITDTTAPLDELFLEATRRGLTTIGIGDGGNEIGMGKVFSTATDAVDRGGLMTATVATDFCIAAGVSNWGAYGLAGALSVLEGRDLLPSAADTARDVERLVREGGAVDGVTHRHEPTVDGLPLSDSMRMLENVRRQISPSPLTRPAPLLVGILGYGEAGRAAAELLRRRGHRVCISDLSRVTLDEGATFAGVETGGHTIDFLAGCDLVVASPGVRADAPIRGALHHRGIPVMSELELGYQLGGRELIAVTGTVGKRTTVELMRELFTHAGAALTIGGNRGRPLSRLICDSHMESERIAVAVSSFQLETVVGFRPHIAVVLNIDDAHLDRHGSPAEYVRIKSRIFMNHGPDDALVLNYDDPQLRLLARKHRGRTLYVSSRQEVDRGAWLAGDRIHLNLDGRTVDLGPAKPPFPENLLSAVVTARLCGIEVERLERALRAVNARRDPR